MFGRILSLLLVFIPGLVFCQLPPQTPSISIIKAKSQITVDGILDEEDWKVADKASNFWQSFPFDTSISKIKSEVRLTYDDQYWYVGAICYDTIEGDYVVQSLKRDFDLNNNDFFMVTVDPFNDQTNAFAFATNPYGVQTEGLVSGGGSRGLDATWDNRWFVEVKQHADKWVIEMAIPFKTLRYGDNLDSWRINFVRLDMKSFQRSSWAHLGRNYSGTMLAFMGNLKWDAPPKKAGGNYAIIPYVNARGSKDFQTNEKLKTTANAGLDGKIAVTSSLNLDITVNPDFSQVDVDQQVTNLTRFSLFFPERRNFFIENSDLFGDFGFSQIRPFFSRRIGLQNGSVIPILGGARLSGKLNENVRIGAMSIQTDKTGDTESGFINGQNFSVGAIQWLFKGNSSISGIAVNKQEFDENGPTGNYNRVLGSDLNFASLNGKWRGKVFSHHSFSPGGLKQNNANASWLMHNSRKVFAMWNHEYVGKNYNAEVGFVPRVENFDFETGEVHRLSFFRLEPFFDYNMYPKGVNKLTTGIYNSSYFDSAFKATENILKYFWQADFKNSSNTRLEYEYKYTRLLFPTDITRTGDTLLQPGEFRNNEIRYRYNSNSRKRVWWNTVFNYGSFFTGTKFTFQGNLSYRWKHLGNFRLSYRRDVVNIPEVSDPIVLNLIGPKIELTFTKKMFFTTFIQYNTQIENLNINSRFQWRFKPMSDLFIVYSDNYDTFNIEKKNRALVVKLVYWFSI